MTHYDWVFWLNLTNIGLGVVVLLAVLLVAYGVVWELVLKYRKAHTLAHPDAELQTMVHDEFSHSLSVPELGLTMADGGEKLNPSPSKPAGKKEK